MTRLSALLSHSAIASSIEEHNEIPVPDLFRKSENSDRKMCCYTTDDGFRLPFLGSVEIDNWDVAGCPRPCNSFVSAKILEHRVRSTTSSRSKPISRENMQRLTNRMRGRDVALFSAIPATLE